MATDRDDRIQLPPTEVDFLNVVGITGQAHDSFPTGGSQPRYDWMRSYLIGLLSCQSSLLPPTQYRIGTIWFNRNKNAYFGWNGLAWVSLSDLIEAAVDINGNVISLTELLASMQGQLAAVQPRMTFSGHCLGVHVTSIPIPSQVQTAVGANAVGFRPLVYINGDLVDPRNTNFIPACPSKILLSGGVVLKKGDKFTVIIERFDLFVVDEVIAS